MKETKNSASMHDGPRVNVRHERRNTWGNGVLLAAMLLGLSGCGATGSVKATQVPAAITTFQFEDRRPSESRLKVQTQEQDGTLITRFGDAEISPPPGTLVQSWLAAHMGNALDGRSLQLHAFEVRIEEPSSAFDEERFQQSTYSVPNPHPLGILLARVLMGAIEGSKVEKTVTVSMATTLDDWPLKVERYDRFKGRVTEADVRGVIETMLGQAKLDIERHYRQEAELRAELAASATAAAAAVNGDVASPQ
jgi:hypothetical protein